MGGAVEDEELGVFIEREFSLGVVGVGVNTVLNMH